MGEALHDSGSLSLSLSLHLPSGQIVAEFSGRAHFPDWTEEASGRGLARGRRTDRYLIQEGRGTGPVEAETSGLLRVLTSGYKMLFKVQLAGPTRRNHAT